MNTQGYHELKAEMPDIAEIVKLYPEDLQHGVFDVMVDRLLKSVENRDSLAPTSTHNAPESRKLALMPQSSSREHFETLLRDAYVRYGLEGRTDIDIGAFVVYAYTEIAPEGLTLATAGPKQFHEFCEITGRRKPGHAGTTLNNGKNRKGYFVQKGPVQYVMSEHGRDFVQNDIMKRGY